MRQNTSWRLPLVKSVFCILWLCLWISIVQVRANSASSNKQTQRWPLSSPGRSRSEVVKSHSHNRRHSLTGRQHQYIQQHQHHRQKRQGPTMYGTMHCFSNPGATNVFTTVEPYWNGDVNFFQIPRNPVTQQYEANMTCEIYFSRSAVSLVYVEFTSCPMQGIFGDTIAIYQLDDPDMPPEPTFFFEDPVLYGTVHTQLSYLDLTFCSDGNSQAVGCSGFFVSYLPGSRKRRSDAVPRVKERTKRFTSIQEALLQHMREDCPSIPEMLDPNAANPLCQASYTQITGGLTCTGVGANPLHDHIYMQLLRCSSLQPTIPEMNHAFCKAILCERYHSMCHVDFFEMRCEICMWLFDKFGATGSPTRFGIFRVLYVMYCEHPMF
ncbi:uncharacterized protein LOC135808903 [Sycon ciliatum]|uniref:uncharacterized protein LOC135808903 n=1 Tax=Sycon ciliatum TaxID=27933 RepID=UPI0031F6BBD6